MRERVATSAGERGYGAAAAASGAAGERAALVMETEPVSGCTGSAMVRPLCGASAESVSGGLTQKWQPLILSVHSSHGCQMMMSFICSCRNKIGAELHIYLEEGTYHKRLFGGPSSIYHKVAARDCVLELCVFELGAATCTNSEWFVTGPWMILQKGYYLPGEG